MKLKEDRFINIPELSRAAELKRLLVQASLVSITDEHYVGFIEP
jgi:hypothetical protein